MPEKELFPCSNPAVSPVPEPPAATDNLGIRCQGPVLAAILGAKLPTPPKPGLRLDHGPHRDPEPYCFRILP
jgi:hypothetical protein